MQRQFLKTSLSYLITAHLYLIFAASIATPSVAQSRLPECRLESFLTDVGLKGVLKSDSLIRRDGALGNETRCTYSIDYSPCIYSSGSRLRDYFTFNMPRTQEDTLVQKKIADVAASLVELIGVQISYTAVSGRVYGATFKDITVGANNYGYRTLDQFSDKLKYWCEIGKADDAKLISLIKVLIESAKLSIADDEKKQCLHSKDNPSRVYYRQDFADNCLAKYGIQLPAPAKSAPPSSIMQMR